MAFGLWLFEATLCSRMGFNESWKLIKYADVWREECTWNRSQNITERHEFCGWSNMVCVQGFCWNIAFTSTSLNGVQWLLSGMKTQISLCDCILQFPYSCDRRLLLGGLRGLRVWSGQCNLSTYWKSLECFRSCCVQMLYCPSYKLFCRKNDDYFNLRWLITSWKA